jgi:hypothetical protein
MLSGVDRAALHDWIDRYERAWRTPGTDGLKDLFTADVVYSPSPWGDPVRGLAALAAFWDGVRDGPEEGFSLVSEVVAIDGDVAIARIEVNYAQGDRWRDLWVIKVDSDGRCVAFDEWPFSPNSADGHE